MLSVEVYECVLMPLIELYPDLRHFFLVWPAPFSDRLGVFDTQDPSALTHHARTRCCRGYIVVGSAVPVLRTNDHQAGLVPHGHRITVEVSPGISHTEV